MHSYRNRILRVVPLIALCLLFQACPTKNATVMCGNLARAESDLGVLNLVQLTMGAIIDLNPETKRGTLVTVVAPPQGSVLPPTPTIDETTLIKTTKLTVNVSADIPTAVKAQLETMIGGNTNFSLKKYYRKTWPSALDVVNNDPDALAHLKSTAGRIILIVSSLIYAEDLSITLSKSITSGAEANVVKVGEFSFKVSYDCSSSLHQTATSGAPLFFKATQAKYDPALGKLVPDSSAINLNEYDLTMTVH